MKAAAAAIGIAMALCGRPGYAVDADKMPFYCEGNVVDVHHPLSFEQLSPQAKGWFASKSLGNFMRYVEEVRDRFDQARPIYHCKPAEAECLASAERVNAYSAALDAYLKGEGVELIAFHTRSDETDATVQVRKNDGMQVEFTVPCATSVFALQASEPDKADILYANELIDQYQPLDAWKRLDAQVHRKAELNLSLLRDGLAMWPWELWLNGHLASDDLTRDPSSVQWVALRPSAGLELAYPNQSEAQAHVRFGLEPIGFVHYIGKGDDRFRKWWGASFLVTLGSDDGAGLGGLVRYDNYWLGLTAHSGSGQVFVFVGLDLYQAFTAAKDKLAQ